MPSTDGFREKNILMILWSEFTTVVHSYCGSQFCVFAYVSDNKFISAMQQEFQEQDKICIIDITGFTAKMLTGQRHSFKTSYDFFLCLSILQCIQIENLQMC